MFIPVTDCESKDKIFPNAQYYGIYQMINPLNPYELIPVLFTGCGRCCVDDPWTISGQFETHVSM